MRDPFQLPENCEPVSFDLDIVPTPLPICSLPPFTEPTLLTPELFFSLPFAPPPWNCFTIPTHVTHDFSPPEIGVPQLRVSVRVKPAPNYDACDPSLIMSINTSLPCLPLSVGVERFGINMFPGEPGCSNYVPPDPSGLFTLEMVPPCNLVAELVLDIPCIAFTTNFEVHITEGAPNDPPTGSGQACVDGCELDLDLFLKLPRVSCPIGSSEFVVNATQGGNEGFAEGHIEITESCGLRLELDINFPSFPSVSQLSCPINPGEFNVNVTHDGDEATASGSIEINADCEISIQLDLNIPQLSMPSCPVTPGAVSVIITEEGEPGDAPTAEGAINIGEDCDIGLVLNLNLPPVRMPSIPSCPVNPGAVSVFITQNGDEGDAPTGDGMVTVNDDCEIGITLNLNIPPPSFPSLPSCRCPSMTFISDVYWSNGLVICKSTVHGDCSVTDGDCDTIPAVECPPKKRR